MLPSRWWPRAAGAAVLVTGLGVGLWPSGGPASAPGTPTLPDRAAGYSYLTGSVSASPPGRAIALFQHGFGVEFLDFPQAVLVGADADVHRRLDEAERRAGAETQGDPAPMLLSPDGTRVAVGDHVGEAPDLHVVDLADGRVDRYAVPGGRSVLPLAWAPDGRTLAYLSSAEPTNPHAVVPIAGDVGLLDLRTGRAAALPGGAGVQAAAFAPDGGELAVQRTQGAGGALDVLPVDGGTGRTVELRPGFRLDGPDAWSPDGRLLATSRAADPCLDALDAVDAEDWERCIAEWEAAVPDVVAFVDATGSGAAVPDPLDRRDAGPGRVLGWPAADRVALLVPDPVADAHDPDHHWVTEVPLDGGPPRRLGAVPTDEGDYGVGRFQLATGLLPGLEIREAGDVDRGRAPLWVRLGTALGAAGAATLTVRAVLPRRGG